MIEQMRKNATAGVHPDCACPWQGFFSLTAWPCCSPEAEMVEKLF